MHILFSMSILQATGRRKHLKCEVGEMQACRLDFFFFCQPPESWGLFKCVHLQNRMGPPPIGMHIT